MPIFVARLIRRFTRLRTWLPPVAVVVFVFVTSWPLMAVFEPASNEIASPANYWWWFLVTAATVGYGDFYPESVGGHIVGVYVIIGGIATFTTLFTQLAGVIEKAKGRRMQGAVTLDTSDHFVVLGYTSGRTEQIIGELLAEGRRGVVLGSWDEVETHPMPERDIEFVRGDLTDEEVLRRACVDRAYSVLVDARDDNEALAMALTVNHIAADAHVVVALRDLGRAAHLRYVSEAVRCVQWHTPRMITEELQAPGITQVYAELMTHGGGNTYSLRLPESLGTVAFGDCQTALGKGFDATALAARTGDDLLVSPNWRTTLPPGTVLYYVGRQRITGEEIARAVRAG
ncbi:MAG: ion transporter [Pseudonocardiaceae bacterium]|nr:ion transporter [Pseudonocardiaceae bacterium]